MLKLNRIESDATGRHSATTIHLRLDRPLDLLQIVLIVVDLHLVDHLDEVRVLQLHRRFQVRDPVNVIAPLQLVSLSVENGKQNARSEHVRNKVALPELSEPDWCKLLVYTPLIELQGHKLGQHQ